MVNDNWFNAQKIKFATAINKIPKKMQILFTSVYNCQKVNAQA